MSADNPLDASRHENRLTVNGPRSNYDSRPNSRPLYFIVISI